MPTLQNFASAKFSELFVISVIFNIYPSGNFKGKNTLKIRLKTKSRKWKAVSEK